MNVDELRKIVESPATSPNDRQTAITELRAKAQGAASGQECRAAREALVELGVEGEHSPGLLIDGPEAELLDRTGAGSLGEVEYQQVCTFCASHRWDAEAEALYAKWISSNKHALGTVLEAYLALHFGERSTAKHFISNSGRGWPFHNCNAEAVRRFLDSGLHCKDAVTVCREFLETGRVSKLPEECECWRITRAIEHAYREKNPEALIDELARVPEKHVPVETARNSDE